MNKSIFDTEKWSKFTKDLKLPAFRQKQIWYEIFKNQNINRDDMTTLSKDLRNDIKNQFDVLSLEKEVVIEDQNSVKIWFKTFDNFTIESVILFHRSKHSDQDKPKLNRITLCVSSQVGCPMSCLFCVTGKLWFVRNLTCDEIISQVLYANNYIKNKFGKKEDGTLWAVRNVVWVCENLCSIMKMLKNL